MRAMWTQYTTTFDPSIVLFATDQYPCNVLNSSKHTHTHTRPCNVLNSPTLQSYYSLKPAASDEPHWLGLPFQDTKHDTMTKVYGIDGMVVCWYIWLVLFSDKKSCFVLNMVI